jgi:hypothetical protein
MFGLYIQVGCFGVCTRVFCIRQRTNAPDFRVQAVSNLSSGLNTRRAFLAALVTFSILGGSPAGELRIVAAFLRLGGFFCLGNATITLLVMLGCGGASGMVSCLKIEGLSGSGSKFDC